MLHHINVHKSQTEEHFYVKKSIKYSKFEIISIKKSTRTRLFAFERKKDETRESTKEIDHRHSVFDGKYESSIKVQHSFWVNKMRAAFVDGAGANTLSLFIRLYLFHFFHSLLNFSL